MSNFAASLANLDRLPSRYTDSVFMFYVKDGVTKVDDVLATQVSVIKGNNTCIVYYELLMPCCCESEYRHRSLLIMAPSFPLTFNVIIANHL